MVQDKTTFSLLLVFSLTLTLIFSAVIPPVVSASEIKELTTGLDEQGYLSDARDYEDYKIYTDAGNELEVSLDGPAGADFDLYVRYGALPDGENDDDMSRGDTADEFCSVSDTVSGFYYITVYSYRGSGYFTLVAEEIVVQGGGGNGEVLPDDVILVDGDTHYDSLSDNNNHDYYSIEVLYGFFLTVALDGPAGADYDLYVREGSRPTTDVYEVRGYTNSADEICQVSNPLGTYYILVTRYSGSGQYSILADVETDDVPPVVEIESPFEGEQVQGTIAISLNVEDNSAIQYVEARVDSGNWARKENSPYEFELDSTGLVDGTHTIDARARDVHGNQGSTTVSFVVHNQPDGDTQLTSGQTEYASLDNSNVQDYYYLEVTEGSILNVHLQGPVGADYDLYVREGSRPTPEVYDARGYTNSANERCEIQDPRGEYYILVNRYSGSGQYSIVASIAIDDDAPALLFTSHLDGATVSGVVTVALSVSDDSEISVVEISLDGGEPASDNKAPYEFSWDTTSHADGSSHHIEAWATDVHGNTGSADVYLTVDNSAPLGAKKYALVIGISDYMYINDLSYADDDAVEWTQYLQGEGYSVRTLYNHQATRRAIIDEMEWLEAQEQAGDDVAFIFTGHGGHFYEAGYSGSGTLLFGADCDNRGHGCISDTELESLFSNFDSDHIFIFFDSCRSGGMDEVAGYGRLVIAACDWDEWSYDAPQYRQGAWTYWFLVWGLEEQGYTSMETCFQAARNKIVREYSLDPQIYDGANTHFYL